MPDSLADRLAARDAEYRRAWPQWHASMTSAERRRLHAAGIDGADTSRRTNAAGIPAHATLDVFDRASLEANLHAHAEHRRSIAEAVERVLRPLIEARTAETCQLRAWVLGFQAGLLPPTFRSLADVAKQFGKTPAAASKVAREMAAFSYENGESPASESCTAR